jgi:4-amino-4-deoxy-L-arabinose transferase-like glycosyltransferase
MNDYANKLKSYPALLAWAILCFIPTLFYYYVGEEGVFTLNSIEMWQHQEFKDVVMYGSVGGRPPLFSWLMIPVALLVGWENVLVASRIVTVMATIGTGCIIAWLAMQLWRDKTVSWTAGILYLVTADVMLYRGWLSYADPLYSMFVVFSIALVWVACLRNNHVMLVAAIFISFAAFLTKALTVYLFLGISMLVLSSNTSYRRFLLSPRAWSVYAVGLLLPLLWLKLGTTDAGQGLHLSNDILDKLAVPDASAYLLRLVSYPTEVLARLFPASFFIGYFLIRLRATVCQQTAVRISLLIALLNFMPYLIAPEGGIRYVLPIYAFVVLAAAYLVVQKTSPFQIKNWIVGMLAIGTILKALVFPYYQKVYRGENYRLMASEILTQYGQYPLYVTNTSSVGLSVAAHIDSMRLGQPAITLPPADFKEGIVIAYAPEDVPGRLLRELKIKGGKGIYLICRGVACGAEKKPSAIHAMYDNKLLPPFI